MTPFCRPSESVSASFCFTAWMSKRCVLTGRYKYNKWCRGQKQLESQYVMRLVFLHLLESGLKREPPAIQNWRLMNGFHTHMGARSTEPSVSVVCNISRPCMAHGCINMLPTLELISVSDGRRAGVTGLKSIPPQRFCFNPYANWALSWSEVDAHILTDFRLKHITW